MDVAAESIPQVDVLGMLGCRAVQASGYTGRGVTVAFIDTGYDGPAEELLAWHDVTEGEPLPEVGHGTMVAGCIRLTAPEAGLVAVRCNRNQHHAAQAIRWVTAHRAEYHIGVINLSLAGEKDPVLISAVREAVGKGLVFVTCMGNHGPRYDGGTCPASLPEVITVGAALNERTVSNFSSRGSLVENLLKPDVCAPGEFIPTWMNPGSQLFDYCNQLEEFRQQSDQELLETLGEHPEYASRWELPEDFLEHADAASLIRARIPEWYRMDDHHLVGRGTSLSAPLVAGVVADLLQAYPQATPAQIKEALMGTARPMDPCFSRVDCGAGFADAEAALRRILSLRAH